MLLFSLGLGQSKVLVLRFEPKMNTKVAFNTHHTELFDQFQTQQKVETWHTPRSRKIQDIFFKAEHYNIQACQITFIDQVIQFTYIYYLIFHKAEWSPLTSTLPSVQTGMGRREHPSYSIGLFSIVKGLNTLEVLYGGRF